MLGLTRQLLASLRQRGVPFCLWKSTAFLERALRGEDDLDLLIPPACRREFDAAAGEIGFRISVRAPWEGGNRVTHLYGLDEESGTLVAADVFDRIYTGGTLLKDYVLPLDKLVFDNVRIAEGGVPVPAKPVELLLFVVRRMIESASPVEHVLMLREFPRIRAELEYLLEEPANLSKAGRMLESWQPDLDTRFLERCVAALSNRAAAAQRYALGRRLARLFASYRLIPEAKAEGLRLAYALRSLYHVARRRRVCRPAAGGKIIAVVGPEGSGKSTIVAETKRWLARHFTVRTIHAGKPPWTALSVVPSLAVPLARRLLPAYRNLKPRDPIITSERGGAGFFAYAIRCLALAHDREALLRRAERWARSGIIVLCDRYPTSEPGSVDGTQLDERALQARGSGFRARLASRERRIYEQLPSPGLVLLLEAPLEVTLHRNATRNKEGGPDPEDYVRNWYEPAQRQRFPKCRVEVVPTDQPLTATLARVKALVCETLASA